MLEVYARDEFRYGVQAFQRGLFNKSILSFEKSLSYKPDDILTKEWLGRAYFRSGFEDSAIDIWRSIIDANQGTALLRSKVETLEARRSLSRTLSTPGRYITAADVSSKLGQDNVLFRRPGSVLPQPNGGFYISAYGSNEILLFDINAALRQRFRGGLEGFDHPFDIIAGPGNTLLISEFEGNRVVQCTADGVVIKTWGKRGLSNGGLLGPQYLCLDDQGYFYVTDAGNRQVVKFDLEGDFVLAFGKKGSGYEGLKSPTGVAFRDGEVFVLDNARKNITVFDGSGNFIRSFGEGLFHSPEGVSIMQDGSFLVADKDRIVKFFPDLETIEVVSDLSGKARRITSAVEDPNGNILAVDFDAETVSILSEIT
ncbi:MAG: 6-bladed beta-propeller, partial [Spirochaetales bacterium]